MTEPRYALLSLFDKTGLSELAEGLVSQGFTLLSTGGTATFLREQGYEVVDVSALTGFPECLSGRVKTLHPLVHGGLLGRRDDKAHREQMAAHAMPDISVLAVNLYPFRETRDSGAGFDDIVEMIDIGGPAMVRSAAKNHAHVIVLVDPDDYVPTLDKLKTGSFTLEDRRRLAARAFAHTAAYDAAIAGWLQAEMGEAFAKEITRGLSRSMVLRYGENPHQRAALYYDDQPVVSPARASLVNGKPLSYNNLLDADAAFRLACDYASDPRPVVAIIKHANPCGLAAGDCLLDAYQRAVACDKTSAFGGIIAMTHPLNKETAQAIIGLFVEVIIAPSAHPDALDVIATKPNVRLLLTGDYSGRRHLITHREILGGMLVQDEDFYPDNPAEFRVVTGRKPSDSEWRDLLFAWKAVRHVKSNALVYVSEEATRAIGAGQMSRLDSARIASIKAGEAWQIENPLKGSVMASDAFFPFPDTLAMAADAGVTAVIQPGGAMRDDEVIALAEARGLAMVFTGKRHFRH